MKALCYYSHRYGNDPANLARARQRFAELKALWAIERPNVVLWAPWLEMAQAGVDEARAWIVIAEELRTSSMLVLDLDGAPRSEGMWREYDFFVRVHDVFECQEIDGDITPAGRREP